MKRLINGCSKSVTLAQEFEEQGWDVWTCDLLPSEGWHKHIQDDIMNHLDDGWDMGIFHPDCTYLSRAGARWLYQGGSINEERLRLGYLARDFFLKLWKCRIPKLCIENPTPLKIFELPPPTCIINPFQFGEPYSKRTLLWLKNLPPLLSTLIMSDYKPLLPSNTGYGKRKGQCYQFKYISKEDSSRNFPLVSKAMAEQWGNLSPTTPDGGEGWVSTQNWKNRQ